MACKDTYKEVKEYVYPNAIVRVHIPDITEEERARRMKIIKQAAENLVRVAMEQEAKKNSR